MICTCVFSVHFSEPLMPADDGNCSSPGRILNKNFTQQCWQQTSFWYIHIIPV